MRSLVSSWHFLMMICSTIMIILSLMSLQKVMCARPCLSHQQSLLLQLNTSLTFQESTTLGWNRSTDCCTWEGVTCQEGRVVGLHLRKKSIVGGLTDNSTLFHLEYLKSLDLSYNYFSTPIPSRFGNLTSLTHLNLSGCDFVGLIPIEISRLTNLVTLDLSTSWAHGPHVLKVDRSNWSMLFRNLTKLQQLYLDGVNMSATGKGWGQVFSSSLPNLQVLSLSDCSLSGHIDPSLLKQQSLSVIHLDENDLSGQVPRFIANFSKLTSLHLRFCNLYGTFPKEIFQVPTLETIDLSQNELLQGSLPEFSLNNSLQDLVVSWTSFSGRLPTSIGNLTKLSTLDLSHSQFNGTLANFMLPKLVYVDLRYNFFNGTLPTSLFSAPSLERIDLSYNQFNGLLPTVTNMSASHMLYVLDLSGNNLEGPIPMVMFQLKNLVVLSLSCNNLNGTIQLDVVKGLVMLNYLDLSHNNLSVTVNANPTALSPFPKEIQRLGLAFCKLKIIPNLKNRSNLVHLDLSDNQIHGSVPNWIWDLGSGELNYLNLSHNYLVGIQEPYVLPSSLDTLDLHFNQISGKIPSTLPYFASYIDLSGNNFYSSIAAGNGLTGVIPESLCNTSFLYFLDLSSNKLSGRIPECMSAKIWQLEVLNLRSNSLTGTIPDFFPVDCCLRTLDLNGNSIQGQIPKSLANCTGLQFVNVGNNNLTDEFPCFLKNMSALQVLILRSNKFHGSIACSNTSTGTWSTLQILDLAHNSFSGELSGHDFTDWKAMMSGEDDDQQLPDHLQFELFSQSEAMTVPNNGQHRDTQLEIDSDFYYEDSTTVTIKDLEMYLVKILTIDICIDFSSNNFSGQIPEELGDLGLLYSLNLSNNAFSGPIPWSLGNLQSLESLDLSRNKLNGTIPTSLAKLNFLSHLDLSFNNLVGMIPSGGQFQTFSANSFRGNQGLCGFPSTTNCTDEAALDPSTPVETKIDWNIISVEIGFIVGFASIIGPLVFCQRLRELFFETMEDVAYSILPLSVTRKWLSWTAAR